MELDALGFAIFIILFQAHFETKHWHLITFWSKKKFLAKRNYSISKSEMLAIIEVYKKCRHYIKSVTHQVVVNKNHANLQRFLID